MSASQRCFCCVKYLMFVFNLVFWLGGCGLFGVGVWLSFTQAEFYYLSSSFPSLSAANLLLVAGGITMVTGFLGCLGALKEQRCLLCTFFVILLILVLTEVTMVLVLYYLHDQVELYAKSNLKDGMKKYASDPELQNSWDNVQKTFKCCGVNNRTDWYDVLNNDLPSSCYLGLTKEPGKEWNKGCYETAKNWLSNNISSMLVFGVCIGVVQILALVFSMQMYCQILHAEKNMD
ncbi:PREDICTED: tetraspanin-4-like [Cyprinodon variegatus]|uniref:tetraspanin-4-like n=1 Tax=Cyprinodon variegatus TaxID=28743 RepID=UPI0007426254|nr:PREDICTED: tetraspanin-4-like [Cyprinodon variegatus]